MLWDDIYDTADALSALSSSTGRGTGVGVMVCITGDVGRGDNSCCLSGPSIICTAGLDLLFLIAPVVVAVFGFLLREEASDGAISDGFAENTIISAVSLSFMSVSDTTSSDL